MEKNPRPFNKAATPGKKIVNLSQTSISRAGRVPPIIVKSDGLPHPYKKAVLEVKTSIKPYVQCFVL